MDLYQDDVFKEIVENSYSFKGCLKNLGYKSYSGDSVAILREKIESMKIDISHFDFPKKTKRCEENIFIENSTADQSTLRLWYFRGSYSPYICSICGQEPLWNGKELTLILDHINGINNDDRLENLRWVCPNCNQQLETTNGKNKQRKFGLGKVAKKRNIKRRCVDCGCETQGKVRCRKCDNIYKRSRIPERDVLKDLIRNHSFVSIGKMFGVTDNAVRKWCDSYNLPRKTSDIKKISNEEWADI